MQLKCKNKKCVRVSGSTPLAIVFLLAVTDLSGASAADVATEPLEVGERQSQVLIEKARVLEAQIQHRQEQMALQPVGSVSSQEYRSGFEDGYNQAIIDLLKSKLLNDPSLSPKPKGAGLYSGRYREPVPHYPVVPPQQSVSRQPNSFSPSPDMTTNPVMEIPAVAPASATLLVTPELASQEEGITATTGGDPVGVNASSVAITVDTGAKSSAAALAGAPSVPSQPQTEPKLQPSPTESAHAWLQKANANVAEKNWPQAIHAATQAINQDASLVDAYIVRSWAYAESGQFPQALEDVGAAINLQADNAVAYNNRGYVHELLDKPDQAQQDYQRACSLGYAAACDTAGKLQQAMEQQRRDRINALTDLSYQQFQKRDWKAVVETTTELLAMDPENSVALVNRAGAYTELGWFNKALDDCNAALIIDPNMAIAYNNKGYVLELMGEPKKAAMEYETACVLGVQQSCSDFKRLSQKLSAR